MRYYAPLLMFFLMLFLLGVIQVGVETTTTSNTTYKSISIDVTPAFIEAIRGNND